MKRYKDKADIDIERKYNYWRGMVKRLLDDDINRYDEEIIRNYFADGLTPKQTAIELLSELTIEEDDEQESS